MTNPLSLPSFYSRTIFTSFLTPCNTFHFSHDSSIWSPSFSGTTFQTLPVISNLLFAVSKFQHHTNISSKCSTFLVPSLSSVQLAAEKSFIPVECCFCPGNPGFNFTCTSYIVCFHATQTVKLFHILRLLLVYRFPCFGDGCLQILIILLFYKFCCSAIRHGFLHMSLKRIHTLS